MRRILLVSIKSLGATIALLGSYLIVATLFGYERRFAVLLYMPYVLYVMFFIGFWQRSTPSEESTRPPLQPRTRSQQPSGEESDARTSVGREG
jgi:hypothetical protein